MLKTIFFGTSSFSEQILKTLLQNNRSPQVVATYPDRPQGRRRQPQANPVKLLATENGLFLKEFDYFNREIFHFLQDFQPDLFIVASYGLIIPAKILSLARLGAINVHPSLLPKLRGATPIQTALRQGLKTTGTTLIKMNEQMDAGDILAQQPVSIKPEECYLNLEKRLATISGKLLIELLKMIENTGKLPAGTPQKSDQATYTKLLTKKDGLVNWAKSAFEIYNQWRAYCHWPRVYTFHGHQKFILTEIMPAENVSSRSTLLAPEKKSPGYLFADNNFKRLLVSTGQGLIEIKRIQPAGKKEMRAENFLNGYRHLLNSNFNLQP